MMEHPFQLGEMVEWGPMVGGSTRLKRGVIVWVVPARQQPPSVAKLAEHFHFGSLPHSKVKFNTLGKPVRSSGYAGAALDHENYVVRVGKRHLPPPPGGQIEKG